MVLIIIIAVEVLPTFIIKEWYDLCLLLQGCSGMGIKCGGNAHCCWVYNLHVMKGTFFLDEKMKITSSIIYLFLYQME